MTREEVKQSITIDDALEVLRNTNAYGIMDIAKSVILDYFANQKSAIEKIKSEIKDSIIENYWNCPVDKDYRAGLNNALDIIDKHMSLGGRRMTREEAIDILQNTSFFGRSMYDIDTAINIAIEALEQEPILDKIRAEIEQLTSRYSISREHGGMGLVEWSDRLIKESDVLQIIDKYKAESEIEE